MSYVLPFKQGQKILELGGGENPVFRPNADFRKLPTVDIVCDFEKRFPIEDESYDGVFGKFIIEHLSWRRTPHFVSEIYRILKPDGLVVLIAPNTFEQCKEILRRNKIGIEENALLYGGQEGTVEETGNYHKAAFNFNYVQELFKKAGFTEVKTIPLPTCHTDMVIEARKGVPQDFASRIKQSEWYRELREDLAGKSKDNLKINAGCFTTMIKGFTNIDKLDLLDYAKEHGFKFQQVDVRYGLPYSDQSAELITSSHLIEHLNRDEAKYFLEECKRVLKPTGTIRIGTPDLNKLVEAYQTGHMGQFDEHQPEEYKGAPSQADKFWRMLTPGHETIYDYDSLKQLLEETGFKAKRARFNKKLDMYPDHTLVVTAKPTDIVKPERKLKVALVAPPFLRVPPDTYGGSEQIIADLAEALAKKGHDVTIFAANGSKVPGCKVVEFGPPVMKAQVNWLEEEKKAYKNYEDKLNGYDIIHDHTWLGYPYRAKLANPELKIIHTHHGGLNWRSKPPGVDKLNLVAISDWMVKVYESQGFVAKRAYNGINLERYPFKAEKGDRLLYVGRFSKFKQPHVAIEVAKKLDMGIDLLGGTFVDDVGYLDQIRELVKGYPKATMYEDAPHQEKLELMRNARALLFPSAMGEPYGLVAVEAWACGTRVIASNDGAIPELMMPEVGIVCNTVQAPDLIDQMVGAVKKIDKISPEACRARAEMFSRENMAERYLRLYREILSRSEW